MDKGKAKRIEAEKRRIETIKKIGYHMQHWSSFNYGLLHLVTYRRKAGRGENLTYNDCFIMADTETSKKPDSLDNHVCAWTISIRVSGINFATLYGHRPSNLCKCIRLISENMNGHETFIYWHNMAYDWTFIRQFMFAEFGHPDSQLNTKAHYPIIIKWNCGITFKDSLILAQRSLEKWGADMNVEHQKAVGKWQYDAIRDQNCIFSRDELEYIEHDTLCGVECMDALRQTLNKRVYSMPFTATGIPREAVRKIGKKHGARNWFERNCLTFDQYNKATMCYHGGYTHANRHLVGWNIDWATTSCRDFASSYPYCMLAYKYPHGKFFPLDDRKPEDILEFSEGYAYMFRLCMFYPCLKDDDIPMPSLQYSKCVNTINAICDNGRILSADYIEIYLTEIDLEVIMSQYKYKAAKCVDVEAAAKDYLPRWLTDYIFSLYKDKTELKGGDSVLYAIRKATLNSVYGMCVQACVKETITEDYATGEFSIDEGQDPAQLYDEYINKKNTILPYQIGVWVTSYAFRNLFSLGACVDYEHGGDWVYSDTDSCYSTLWDEQKLNAYNDSCRKRLQDNGYGPVMHNGREYWLGVAEFDGSYTEFKTMGAKRYCGRSADTGKLKITVAGVPKKKGALCLDDNIDNFQRGFIFSGEKTGKLTHTYIFRENIYTDANGNETADSINLTPCDYLLDTITIHNWEEYENEEISIQTYEEQ